MYNFAGMETLQFKTNINCDACVAKVTPVLNANPEVAEWQVDTTRPDKMLTVKGEHVSPDLLAAELKAVGYTITLVTP
jgi:copper chaperone